MYTSVNSIIYYCCTNRIQIAFHLIFPKKSIPSNVNGEGCFIQSFLLSTVDCQTPNMPKLSKSCTACTTANHWKASLSEGYCRICMMHEKRKDE